MQKSFCGAYDLSGLIARIQAVKDINALRLNIPRYVDTFEEEEEMARPQNLWVINKT